ncbi:PDZ domain-containing protein [Synechococcales cyanobacterium C]|uniref:PDZ domain-containing protein n=1 Tax=Petrachloros mirabilis ULC683 TaxID=2781853 RepID=A0A8K2A2G1_9CYAN|nr:M61 family metallopeptidase [Petrachloros mirabilis]NCJ08332.1 PDZ domain-containing protein [Petrachloros mirabilis ULC683]
MPEAVHIPTSVKAPDQLRLHYQVSCPNPSNHVFEVMLHLPSWTDSILNLKMPVWTPGSYLVREYAKQLQDFIATDGDGQPLRWQKCQKNHWQIQTAQTNAVTVQYRIFANELTVRTNHLDLTHGYFNPAAVCLYIPGWEQTPIQITVQPPTADWHITTPLPPAPGQPHTFLAQDFDTLVDSPFEMGTHACYDFEVEGKPHQWAIWGRGNAKPERIIADTQKIIQTEAAIFGGLPYERYWFLLHLANGYGGLEHRNCCSLIYPRFKFNDSEGYARFMSLVAHEFFHLWNVKRIRPKALETFDYDQENYIDCLWFCEGVTSYYDLAIPMRAGIYDAKTFLKFLSESITRLQTTPGRKIQSLSESSFDTWIKLYRPDANSKNSQISYYLKGELVALLLDLLIRQRHHNRRSLDDVMRQMWEQFGKTERGFQPAELKAIVEAVAGTDLSAFWRFYIEGTDELPFDEYLHPFGLAVKAEGGENNPPYWGLDIKSEGGVALIKQVLVNSPAQQAGLEPGDELVAIAGFRVTAEQINDRLRDYQAGQSLEVTVFHQDELRTTPVILAPPQPNRYILQPVTHPTATQVAACRAWLGVDLAHL